MGEDRMERLGPWRCSLRAENRSQPLHVGSKVTVKWDTAFGLGLICETLLPEKTHSGELEKISPLVSKEHTPVPSLARRSGLPVALSMEVTSSINKAVLPLRKESNA